MFYNRGEVLSDQFDHFKLILFLVPQCSFCSVPIFLFVENVPNQKCANEVNSEY